MSPPPELESFAANLYYGVAPVAGEDDQHDFALAKFSGALGVMFQALEDLARDTPEGPGWSSVMDLDRCPPEWLPWLAQFVGVTVPAGLSTDDARAWIASTDGFKRGTPAALKGALAPTLTGSKTVFFRERDGGPYLLTVLTRTDETPDQAASLAALLAQKPGGILLTYYTVATWDYAEMKAHGGTYATQSGAYDTYTDLSNNTPKGATP